MDVTNITDVMLLLTIVDNSYINLEFISGSEIPLQIYHFRQINLPFRKTGDDRSSKFRCRRSTSRIDTSGKIESQADSVRLQSVTGVQKRFPGERIPYIFHYHRPVTGGVSSAHTA